MSVILFLAILFILVLVHELGHFVVAKWTGMKVEEFGIGFPPKLFGIRKGETEYTLNALPIGGFVKIVGENLESIEGEDSGRSFANKNKWAQSAVLIAGVTMNVLLAFVLFASIYMAGVPTAVSEDEASRGAELVVTEVVTGSPAETVGLIPGARVISLETDSSRAAELTPSSFADFIAVNEGETFLLTYEIGEEENKIEVTPEVGVLGSEEERPAIGVGLSLVEHQSLGFFEALIRAGETTAGALVAIVVGVSALIADAFTLSADLSQVAGPVGIVGLVDDAATIGLISLLSFTAFISLNLAVINLLPVPALDGGRLLFVLIEAIIRRPINPAWMGRVNFIGFALLILLMIAVTFSDITKLI